MTSIATSMDEDKKLKRVIANRKYHEKYRVKQLCHVARLEEKEKSLRAEVITANVMLGCVVRQNNFLRVENDSIREKITACSSVITVKQAQYEQLLQELDLLKQSYMYQQSQSEMKMNQQASTESTPPYHAEAVEAAPPLQAADMDPNLSQLDIENMMQIQQLCEQNDEQPPINLDIMTMNNEQSPQTVGPQLNENVMATAVEPNLQPQEGMKQTEFEDYLIKSSGATSCVISHI